MQKSNCNDREKYFVKKDKCPYCGKRVDSAGMHDNDNAPKPVPGNLAVCMRCTGVAEYGEDMSLQKFDTSTLEKDDAIYISDLQERIKQMHKIEGVP